jgi:hypothetical protein
VGEEVAPLNVVPGLATIIAWVGLILHELLIETTEADGSAGKRAARYKPDSQYRLAYRLMAFTSFQRTISEQP